MPDESPVLPAQAPPGLPIAPPGPEAPRGATKAPSAGPQGPALTTRDAVVHQDGCKIVSVLPREVAAVFARSPGVLGVIACPHCRRACPVAEFRWQAGGGVVGV